MVSERSNTLSPGLKRLSILRMLWKRKYLIGVVWICVTAATYFGVKLSPPVYVASALVMVNSQKIPERFVSSTVVSDSQDRLAALSLEILSNKRLEEIINRFDLYREERRVHPLEKILDTMRTKDLTLHHEAGFNGRTASFRVGFQGPDRFVVAQVANLLANLYVQ